MTSQPAIPSQEAAIAVWISAKQSADSYSCEEGAPVVMLYRLPHLVFRQIALSLLVLAEELVETSLALTSHYEAC